MPEPVNLCWSPSLAPDAQLPNVASKRVLVKTQQHGDILGDWVLDAADSHAIAVDPDRWVVAIIGERQVNPLLAIDRSAGFDEILEEAEVWLAALERHAQCCKTLSGCNRITAAIKPDPAFQFWSSTPRMTLSCLKSCTNTKASTANGVSTRQNEVKPVNGRVLAMPPTAAVNLSEEVVPSGSAWLTSVISSEWSGRAGN